MFMEVKFMEMCDCVSFLVIKDGRLLVEKRKEDKAVDPGLRCIPGGHCESGESPEDALSRELKEELDIVARDSRYICTLVHLSEEVQKIHYYVTEDWKGIIQNNEAESLFWIELGDLESLNKILQENLDIEADRLAVNEYLRLYKNREKMS